jgi:hypothetical protein
VFHSADEMKVIKSERCYSIMQSRSKYLQGKEKKNQRMDMELIN